MAASQAKTRRRSSRLGPDESLEPPVKRQKTAPSKQLDGRKPGAYSEDTDGFNFSRRGKRAAPEPAVSRSDQPASPPKRRRSARLSGDVQPSQPPTDENVQDTAPTTINRGRSRAKSPLTSKPSPTKKPPAPASTLPERKPSPTRIALPFADTPIIVRNRAMRQTNNHNRRRSSSSLRGRRASSLLDSGSSNAMPHGQVEATDFYKHISQDLPEPRRMMQLLTWCGARAMPEKPSGSESNISCLLAARVIQEELLNEFPKNSALSNWFEREEEYTPVVLVRKPNPRNVQNAQKLHELEHELRRLEGEKQTWRSLLASLDKSSENFSRPEAISDESRSDSNTTGSSEKLQAAHHDLLGKASQSTSEVRKRVSGVEGRLEKGIDALADASHSLHSFTKMLQDTSQKVNLRAAGASRGRHAEGERRNATDKAGVRDILSAFSRAGRA